MTSLIRSERVAAGLLLLAAVVGLVVANTPAGPGLLAWADGHLALPAIGIDLSLRHWVSDGLLVVFFFIVAVELKHEFLAGGLNSVSRALVPAIAAVGGVVVPALVYLAITAGSGLERGWPVPTATDIAFALGVLAVFGRGLPAAVRVFLLALAVLDDLIAIGIIAVFFTTDLDLGALAIAVAGVVLFAVVGRLGVGRTGAARIAVVALLVLVALVTWWATLSSGIHATIAGVALGFALPASPGSAPRTRWSPPPTGSSCRCSRSPPRSSRSPRSASRSSRPPSGASRSRCRSASSWGSPRAGCSARGSRAAADPPADSRCRIS